MCGIFRIAVRNAQIPTGLLERGTQSLAHRGPDDSGTVLLHDSGNEIGLGNRRLAILDLSPLGHQPMQDPDTGNCIVYNREIYVAVNHVDDTGRLQTVTRKENPLYYDLICAFHRKTGIPVILNTSFNEDEPIVCTTEEAIDCFQRTRMDVLAVGSYLVVKPQHDGATLAAAGHQVRSVLRGSGGRCSMHEESSCCQNDSDHAQQDSEHPEKSPPRKQSNGGDHQSHF
jgi:carbamoyltransferase-like protein/glutamine amidotransferase-like protein